MQLSDKRSVGLRGGAGGDWQARDVVIQVVATLGTAPCLLHVCLSTLCVCTALRRCALAHVAVKVSYSDACSVCVCWYVCLESFCVWRLCLACLYIVLFVCVSGTLHSCAPMVWPLPPRPCLSVWPDGKSACVRCFPQLHPEVSVGGGALSLCCFLNNVQRGLLCVRLFAQQIACASQVCLLAC